MVTFHDVSAEKALSLLATSRAGLSESEVNARLSKYGYNELRKEGRASPVLLFIGQFRNFLILLLVAATAISLFLREFIEAGAMLSIILLSAVLGFVQEFRAERAIEALEKISAPTARVVRNGQAVKVAARELVPGDIILLEAGDVVPADSRVIESVSLQIDESSLTGESLPSAKVTAVFKPETSIADQENMAFMGTVVTYGKGRAVVTSTGMSTEFGRIASSIQATPDTKTPLQAKFEQMARQIGAAVLVLVFFVFVGGLLQGELSFAKLFVFALSLVVATVPSALPAIVTISLALGAKTLAARNMIIKKLPAAESLGSVTIICSDKTGTITRNEMTVTRIFADDTVISVSGSGYDPTGRFSASGRELDPKDIELLLRIGFLCNNAKLSKTDAGWNVVGDPTEGSLVVLARKGGLSEESLVEGYSPVQELPFDSERKMMSVVYKVKGARDMVAYVKGAPDVLLRSCDKVLRNGKVYRLDAKERQRILETNDAFAGGALRVLGLAYRELPLMAEYSVDSVEANLVFVGLVGMIDPPREEVRAAVSQCHEAGIRVMVITGDHALTAKAVARQIGLFSEGDLILTGEKVERMSEHELAKIIDSVRIIARALPIQKSKVVDALKSKGYVVAMTGDGVNDAPALKKADIGIAMGITGTDVAKEVSKGILADDNFATIVNAVAEGRNIYDKMIKSTRYLLSCNVGEIITVFFAIMLRLPLPLVPLQILLMNLVTDGVPALGLGVEPAEGDVMKRPPRNPKEKPITGSSLLMIILFGIVMGAGTLFIFNFYYDQNNASSLRLAQTAAFTTLVLFEMFAVLGSRSLSPFRKLNPFTNKWLLGGVALSVLIQVAVVYVPFLQPVFSTVPLGLGEWVRILIVSSLGFVLMELGKFFITQPNNHASAASISI
ncbi:cation-translocating P-type ATPase [Candidatus Woesearchaeota archaeon]|nr:cation-translocating P-type ATPase [Candidatus Woesearchaeota archaeon]